LSEFTRTIKEDTMSVVKDVVKHDDGGGRGSGGSGGGSTSSASGAKRPPAKAGTSRSGRSSATTSSSGLNTFFDFMDSLKDEEEEEVLCVVFPLFFQGVALVTDVGSWWWWWLASRAKSRREKGVKKLQKDMNTYTQEPADEEDFKEWKASFNLEAHTVEISQLLSANNKMRAIHNELCASPCLSRCAVRARDCTFLTAFVLLLSAQCPSSPTACSGSGTTIVSRSCLRTRSAGRRSSCVRLAPGGFAPRYCNNSQLMRLA
jgi:hypothetical protein